MFQREHAISIVDQLGADRVAGGQGDEHLIGARLG